MKTIKTLLLSALLTLVAASAAAKPVEPSMARRVAANLLGDTALVDRSAELPFEGLFLFTPADGRGFAVIAGDNCALPVVGYSRTNTFSLDAKAPMDWLANVARRIADLQQRGIEGTAETDARWQQALGNAPKSLVGPLCTTQWNQSPYYNDLCPYDEGYGVRAVTGCGATAIAQIMKYWSYPAVGTSSHCYNHPTYGQLCADFGATTYAWDSMPDIVTAASSDSQRLAVATLMYHCGVALHMEYTAYNSNSYIYYEGYYGPTTEAILPAFFGYSSDIRSAIQSEYTDAEWTAILRGELDAGCPMIYRGGDVDGSGHIFVCDGYDDQERFHINWGWGGYADGFYALGALNPDEYSSWNLGTCAVIGIHPRPAPDGNPVVIAPVANDPDRGTITVTQPYINNYIPELDSVYCLEATANPGYRFLRWNDNCRHNPRRLHATESRSDTAIFVPIHPDTIAFCQPGLFFSYGWGYETGQPTYWGIRIPKQTMDAEARLAGVKVYIDENPDVNRRVSIYNKGISGPDSLIYTQDCYLSGRVGWTTLLFDSLVGYNPRYPVWVVMSTSGVNYPAACSRYGGVPDGCWFKNNSGGWFTVTGSYYYCSWLMKALVVSPHSGISPVAEAPFRVAVEGRTLSVAATDPDDLPSYYDLQGRLLATGTSYTVPAAGVYLVRLGDKLRKIVVQ